VKARAAAVLAVAGGAHVLHDAFSEVLYVFLPLWAAEFGLGFTEIGLLRTSYSGGMALFQVPAGVLAERWGERPLLAAGTAVTAAGFLVAAGTTSFWPLLLALVVAGLGSGVQHPLSSTLVAQAYEAGGRRAALGTYNFAGDVGKVAGAAGIGMAAALVGWRWAGAAFGALGVAAAAVIGGILAWLGVGGSPSRERAGPGPAGWGIRDTRGFGALAAIGMVDNLTRTGFLTLLPFALIAQGATVAGVGGAFALLFAGGAAGKFVCGLVAERVGVTRTVILTELATTAGIVALPALPLAGALLVLPALGIALNGTSSVLYGTVADLVRPERRSRAYGLYYTLGVGASAAGPLVYGVVSDLAGVPATLAVVGAVVLVTIPLCLALRPAVRAAEGL
jgi:MFS family permease